MPFGNSSAQHRGGKSTARPNSPIPTGLCNSAQGCESASYPGYAVGVHNSNGVATVGSGGASFNPKHINHSSDQVAASATGGRNPVGVVRLQVPVTQGSSCLAPLG